MKDKIFIGTELFIGKTIYLPKRSKSINFIDYKDGRFTIDKPVFEKYVLALKNAGVNSFRSLLPYYEPVDVFNKEGTGKLLPEELLTPFEYDSDRLSWDLEKFNDDFFSILEYIVGFITDENTYFVLDIVDNCLFSSHIGHFFKNIQNVQLYDKGAYLYIHKLIDKLYETLKAYEHRIIWELGNEIGDVDLAFDIYEYLMEKGIKPELITLGINLNLSAEDNSMKELRNKIKSKYGVSHLRKSFFVIHGHLKKDDKSGYGKGTHWAMKEAEWIQSKKAAGRYNIRVFVSTDGTGDGNSKCDIHPRKKAKYRIRPSFAQWEKWLVDVFENYYVVTDDGLPAIYAEQFIKVQDINCQVPFFKRYSELYRKYFGEYPYNYGKFQELQPEPEPQPGPSPVKEYSCFYYLSGSVLKWDFKRFLMCVFKLYKKRCK